MFTKIQATTWARITGMIVILMLGEIWVHIIANQIFASSMKSLRMIPIFVVAYSTSLSRLNREANQLHGEQSFVLNSLWSSSNNLYCLLIASDLKLTTFPLILMPGLDSFTA